MKSFARLAGALLLVVCHGAQAQAKKPEPEPVVPQGIQVEPKYFEPTSGTDAGGLGFSYSINVAIPGLGDKKPPAKKPAAPPDLSKPGIESDFSTMTLDFQARGNVALNKDINPSDFLKTGLDLAYVSSRVVRGELDPGCDMTNPDTVELCKNAAMSGLRFEAAFTGSLESDQKFDKQAKTYGGKAMVAYVPTHSSWMNKLNVLDWPFRLLRVASGADTSARGEPHAFPRFLVAAERVKPDKDPEREAILGSKEDYDRVNFELAFSAPAGVFQQRKFTFDWSVRYFEEIDAPEAIKAAKLDHFRYSAVSVRVDGQWRLTYATGRLPFDRASDKVWELGYNLKLF
jgi:hypothetical protein